MEHHASYFSEALKVMQSPSKTQMGTMIPLVIVHSHFLRVCCPMKDVSFQNPFNEDHRIPL